MTSDRTCARPGCMTRGKHFASCPDYGKTDGDCRGCVPSEARDGAIICERCYRAVRGAITDAPDLVGHLRSIADPTKSSWNFDRLSGGSRAELPAPVQAAIIDASNDVMTALRAWALDVQFGYGLHPWSAAGLEAGADAEAAYEDAVACADLILDDLDRIANDAALAVKLHADFASRSQGEPDRWTVADAIARWPLDDAPRVAAQPCPECDLRTVHVQPSRRVGQPTRYLCKNKTCKWMGDSNDDAGLWAAHFRLEVEREENAVRASPEHARPHDPRWPTLAEAARLAHRTPGTVRKWAE